MESISLRWIPLIPLIAFGFNVFLGGRLGRSAGLLASAAVAVSFILSVSTFWSLPAGGSFQDLLYVWIESEPFKATLSFHVDSLSAVMLLVVTGIGLLIHIYSLGYMSHDEGMARYFAYLNLFVFFMLVLVMADNLPLLFVGWEGVGLCSYLLIGFWHQDHANTIAGNKAFVVNRIGDFGFLLGILLLFWEMGRQGIWTVDILEIRKGASLLPPDTITLITLLLFMGAAGKSAQIPLYVWLPDAMQGPTPVSALIHAATMVTAGVYMVARLHFLFSLAPETLDLIALIGALTAFFAATIALVQNDIKRVLAYSTVSQLGYMFLAVGVGAFSAAIFHLFTHAFFKACLFLSAGSVIHGLGGEQDMRKMGGLSVYFPITYSTYFIAALAISGAPLSAGFFSKDQILWQAYAAPRGSLWLWLVAWLTAGLTAFYMFRQFFIIFHGPCRVEKDLRSHLHEAPIVMTAPLILLALGSIFAGWLWMPDFLWGRPFERWLEPVFGAGEAHYHGGIIEALFMLLTLIMAAGAGSLAFLGYVRRGKLPQRLSSSAGGVPYRWLLNKYYVDEAYDLLLVRPFTLFSSYLAESFDLKVIDGIVNGMANRVRESSLFWRQLQSGNVQHYLFGFVAGVLLVLAYFLYG